MAKLVDLDGLAYFYSKIKAMLADKLGKNDVATVATSGSYNDLSDKPTIPSAYTLPTASSTVLGGVKVGSNISVSDGTISLNKSNVTSALGYTPPTSDTVYDNATTSTAGLMSASDKAKLNGIADYANNYTHPSTHPASMITGLADVAKSGSYNDLSDKPTMPIVPSNVSAFTNDAGYLTQHQSLNGYVKSVNNTKPDSNGNVNITVSGGSGVSLSTQNTWTAQQNFQSLKFDFEKYTTPRSSGAYDAPHKTTACYNATGAFTLNVSNLIAALNVGESTLFTACITSSSSYSLSITNAGTLKYVGAASDLAITASGLLLNILIVKESSGTITSIVQATKLA